MAKNYSLVAYAALFFIALLSCAKESKEAKKPVYLSIQDMFVNTNYSIEGTSNQKITTVWLEVNGKSIGAFEMPATPPVILNEGNKRRHRSLLNRHNGLIECHSEPGNTVFSLFIPLEQVQ